MISRMIVASIFSLALTTSVMAQAGNGSTGASQGGGASASGSDNGTGGTGASQGGAGGPDNSNSGENNNTSDPTSTGEATESGTEGNIGAPKTCPANGMTTDAAGKSVKCSN